MARWLLAQVTHKVLRRDLRLREWFKRIKRRRGSTIARVAVMRKLATIIWHMLSKRLTYAESRALEATPSGGFSALVPIPNGRGRHRAAPFGVGPWDGAQVASQQSPTLRPGQRDFSGQAQRRQKAIRFGSVVRSELPCGNLRSLVCSFQPPAIMANSVVRSSF
jgi:hypothetical protein